MSMYLLHFISDIKKIGTPLVLRRPGVIKS